MLPDAAKILTLEIAIGVIREAADAAFAKAGVSTEHMAEYVTACQQLDEFMNSPPYRPLTVEAPMEALFPQAEQHS
jgi:hypothetical protein